MKVSIGSNQYDCIHAVKRTDKAVLFLEDGGTVELCGVTDWSGVILEGGDWEIQVQFRPLEEKVSH